MILKCTQWCNSLLLYILSPHTPSLTKISCTIQEMCCFPTSAYQSSQILIFAGYTLEQGGLTLPPFYFFHFERLKIFFGEFNEVKSLCKSIAYIPSYISNMFKKGLQTLQVAPAVRSVLFCQTRNEPKRSGKVGGVILSILFSRYRKLFLAQLNEKYYIQTMTVFSQFFH